LHRVMIHGVLHLMDYKDKRKIDKFKMTEREDFYLLALKL
jgi:probable rRNA maturation factor